MLEYELTLLNTAIQNDLYDEIVSTLNVSDFSILECKTIFTTIKNLYKDNKNIDYLLLQNEIMKKHEDWSDTFMSYLSDYNTDIENFDNYIELIKDAGLKRKIGVLVNSYGLFVQDDKTKTGQEILDEITAKIDKLNDNSISKISSTIEILYEVKDTIELRCDPDITPEERLRAIGIPTSFNGLDEMVIAFGIGELIVIGSRPSMGKTTLITNILRRNAVNLGIKSCLFSCEMTRQQITENMLCAESETTTPAMRSGNILDWDKITSGVIRLAETPIFIDDTPNISLNEIKAKTRLLMKKHDIKIVGIDYIQLMRPTTTHFNREQQIAEISRGLKAIAKQLKIPIVALCQLNKEVERRAWVKDDKGVRRPPKPRMSDTRESEAIFNDCDVGLLLHRDYYYTGEPADRNKAMIIVGKNRNLAIGDVEIKADLQYLRFSNLGEETKKTKYEEEIDKIRDADSEDDEPPNFNH